VREWYASTDLTGLPGLPTTDRGIRIVAKREGWKSRRRSGRGGGSEYHVGSLPAEARNHLVGASVTAPAEALTEAPPASEAVAASTADTATAQHGEPAQAPDTELPRDRALEALAAFNRLPPAQRDRARAREWCLRAWRQFGQAHGVPSAAAAESFCRALAMCEVPVPDHVRAHLPVRHGSFTLSARTLHRWWQTYREHGIAGLATGYGNRDGQSRFDTSGELRLFVLGLMAEHPHITGKRVMEVLEATKPELARQVSVRSLQRWMRTWQGRHHQIWAHVTNPDAWKGAYKAAFGSASEHVTRLNQLWELDSTPGDWMLTDGRHTVLGVIDVYSRRLKLVVSKTSKATAVCAVLRKAMLSWGVPEAIKTDNGSDYVSDQIGLVVRGLNIEQETCPPFTPEAKPHIERAFRTMSHGLLELLPGFCGHNVAERQAIRERTKMADRIQKGEPIEVALSSTELQQLLDQWEDAVYAREAHGGLGGRTPFAVAAAWSAPVRRIADERALDMLLAEMAGHRTVSKKGVRLDGQTYIAAELVDHIGGRVTLKWDGIDLGRVYVYDEADRFVCIASCPELTGISRVEVASAAHARQKKLISQQRAELRIAKREATKNPAKVVLDHRVEEAAKVVALHPQPGADHQSAGLEEAQRAAQAVDSPPSAPADPERERHQADVLRRLESAARVAPETARDRFRRCVRLQRALDGGGALSGDELAELRSFTQTAEFRAELRMHQALRVAVDGAQITEFANLLPASPARDQAVWR
jgi:hypothetical protein